LEIAMNTTSHVSAWISLGALVIASTAAVAAEPESAVERSRAEVVSETLAARAAGTLAPAGEVSTPLATAATARSSLTRSAVESQVLSARASGTLIPAGEGVEFAPADTRGVSVFARADVKATVIAARKAGDLIPAGEGPDAETHAHARTAAVIHSARDESAIAKVANR
jgi:hypothetical protein